MIIVVIICVALGILILKYVFSGSGPNLFETDTREPLKEMVHDRKERKKVLKQGFLASKVPENLDAIIIGSGVGGLGLAVLLAKVGKKVLVLEQHGRAGGCSHTFTEKSFEFDVGIHYIGDLLDHKPFRCMLDSMTNGQLQWEPLENPYDQVVLGPPENRRQYPIYSGRTRFPEELKKCFPGEEKAIDEYLRLVKVHCGFMASGVSVMKGQEEVHIRAPMVISNAGIFNTYQLLPKELQTMPAIQWQLSMMKNGIGGLSVFVGLNGTKEELGLKANNYWIFAENNFDELLEKYLNAKREESAKSVPLLVVSSPSTKDPTSEERSPGKSTLSLISFANYKWFEEWKDGKVTNRPAEYKELKQAFIDSTLEVVMGVFPKITRDKVEYIDAGTPITNTHYIRTPKGEFYGADHGIARFSPELGATLRPQTPLKNLYLTGQDLFVCGFAGALAGALTCGSVILNRNLHLDTIALAKKLMNDKLKGE
ncbi:all-trans-retinol 13,14-reductase-like [Chaetodon trifascialis]|uniref:all-trans-retinol 13,14-reductase-like n=1 Tax=Chaetodon trifascialis TaxID=109706 RepID=UPI0039959D5C